MPIGFGNLFGLLALLSLIPFIVLFFVRPKPKEVTIPSLMFWEDKKEFKSKSGFFRRLFSDKLLFLQIIILGLIALFFSAPQMEVSQINTGNVVLVLDNSASIGNEDKFSEMKKEAINNLGTTNTLIEIGSSPQIIFRDFERDDAKKEIQNLKFKQGTSSIAESLEIAKDIILESSGERAVVLISDLIDTKGGDVNKAINEIVSEGVIFSYKDYSFEEKDNVGIISLSLSKDSGEARIKNFCCSESNFEAKYGSQKEGFSLSEGETANFEFDLEEGKEELVIDIKDSIEGDNTVYILNDEEEKTDVLLITNEENKNLRAALSASPDVNFDVKSSNSVLGNYDVYIVSKLNSISSSLASSLEEKLGEGKGVIIVSEEGISGDYKGLIDYDIKGNKKGSSSEIIFESSITKGLELPRNKNVRILDCDCEGVYVTSSEQPVLMLNPYQGGVLGYYGIDDATSGFDTRPDYAILWNRVIKYLAGKRGISEMNLEIGNTIIFGEEVSYETPSGQKGKSNTIIFDEVGFYEVNDKVYSSNILDEKESNLEISNENFENEELEENVESVKRDIWKYLIILAILLIIVEWISSIRKMRRRRYNV